MKRECELEKTNELTKIELNDMKSLNSTLKTKLQEAQESLKSNENLITYLNKQLNDKPTPIPSGLISGQSTQSSFAGKLASSAKPPTPGMGGTFKPSFSSLD